MSKNITRRQQYFSHKVTKLERSVKTLTDLLDNETNSERMEDLNNAIEAVNYQIRTIKHRYL